MGKTGLLWEHISWFDDTVKTDQTQINFWQRRNSPSYFSICCALLQSDLMCLRCLRCNHVINFYPELQSHDNLSFPFPVPKWQTTLAGPATIPITNWALSLTQKVGRVKWKPRTCVWPNIFGFYLLAWLWKQSVELVFKPWIPKLERERDQRSKSTSK